MEGLFGLPFTPVETDAWGRTGLKLHLLYSYRNCCITKVHRFYRCVSAVSRRLSQQTFCTVKGVNNNVATGCIVFRCVTVRDLVVCRLLHLYTLMLLHNQFQLRATFCQRCSLRGPGLIAVLLFCCFLQRSSPPLPSLTLKWNYKYSLL